jgi:flavin reductase (DIM6/NTAB) family NADH-FMN oxidoreductase RutF
MNDRRGVVVRPTPEYTTPDVAPAEYRALMSGFPTGVAVVTTSDCDGRPRGLTCTSLTSVTVSPPVLLVSLSVASGTLRSILESRTFAVNLLHSGAREVAIAFSSAGADRFGRVPWRRTGHLGLPCLETAAFAVAECVLVECFTSGDHVIVFGRVVSVAQTADVPLLYGLRQFSSWPVAEPTRAGPAGHERATPPVPG